MSRRPPIVPSLFATAFIAVSTLLSSPVAAQHGSRATSPTIPQVARTAGQFGTLLAAVDAAGLTQTLLGRGPFTLFAPTDEAFAKLADGTVRDLLKPENREQLRTILTYHVVAGRVTAAQARNVRSANTVAGPALRISQTNDELRINDATVRIADVPASNGLIHVIDRVLLPPPAPHASSASGTVVSVIDYAIDRGAPLYNEGAAASTVAIYEVAITALLSLEPSALSSDSQRRLRAALGDTRGSDRERATRLRRALDDARALASDRMSSASR